MGAGGRCSVDGVCLLHDILHLVLTSFSRLFFFSSFPLPHHFFSPASALIKHPLGCRGSLMSGTLPHQHAAASSGFGCIPTGGDPVDLAGMRLTNGAGRKSGGTHWPRPSPHLTHVSPLFRLKSILPRVCPPRDCSSPSSLNQQTFESC